MTATTNEDPHLTVLVSTSSFGKVDPRPLEMLKDLGIRYKLNPHGRKLHPAESRHLLQDVDGVIAGTELLDRDLLQGLPRLRVISRVGIGLENVDLAAADDLGIRVFNTPEAHVDPVAELTLGGMIDVLRSVSRADRDVRAGKWDKPMGNLLRNRTVGIVGLGRIGKRLVELLRPFDVTVLAFDTMQDADWAVQHGVTYLELDELVRRSDIVTLHLPYSKALRHLFGPARLDAMKEGSILVNCGRGGLVDESALADRLASGRLGGAFLDTFEEEPYRGPLLELENAVLTPHIGSYAAEGRKRMEMEAVENVIRFFGRGNRS